jgi:putative selenium metabolism hydrolase
MSDLLPPEMEKELIKFAQDLVRIKSLSGDEGEVIHFIEAKLRELGYEEITIDSMGNLLGRIGEGGKTIQFDAHVDTVDVNDEEEWRIPPFSGDIVDGRLHGRGSVDMKSAVAASIYAAALAKRLGFTKDKTIYVSSTVLEEECDGQNLKHLFKELNLRPDYVVICEPSDNIISLGHKGKAQISLKTHGLSAHGSAPEKGVNAIYEMTEIIQRVEKTNLELMKRSGVRGSLAMCRISSVSASINAIPTECEVYLDRRIIPGETEEVIKQELEELIKGKNASWEVGTLHRRSWTGMDIEYEPFHPAWKIDMDHKLTKACIAAYKGTFGKEPTEYEFWDFSTNGLTPAAMGIPTIGFGPGEYKLAHMRDESCEVSQILEACNFYTRVIEKL